MPSLFGSPAYLKAIYVFELLQASLSQNQLLLTILLGMVVCYPNAVSNSLICLLIRLCATGSPFEARAMLPNRTTFSKVRNLSSETPFFENMFIMTVESCDMEDLPLQAHRKSD